MHPSVATKPVAFLIANSIWLSSVVLAQTPRDETRPRRTQTASASTASGPNIKDDSPATPKQWTVNKATTLSGAGSGSTDRAEPMIRVALATDLRAANVS